MAYNFARASSQYMSVASTPVTAAPLTMAVWANVANTTTFNEPFHIGATSGADNRFYISFSGNAGGDPLQFFAVTNTIYWFVSSTSAYTANQWSHGAGITSSSTSRTVYLNGGSSATNTSSSTPANVAEIWIANYRGSANYDGDAAECAIWNVALTADEVVSLSKGFRAHRIRPQSLVFYAPLIRDIQDIRDSRVITNTNATVAVHPRVY